MPRAGQIEPVDFSAPFTSNGVATGLDLPPLLNVTACPHCGYKPTRQDGGPPAMKVTVDNKCGKCGRALK